MRVRTSIKAGGVRFNHNQTIAHASNRGMKVKTGVKAGARTGRNPATGDG